MSNTKQKYSDFSILSHQQQWYRRKKLNKDVNQALSFMENDGTKPSVVKFFHTKTTKWKF